MKIVLSIALLILSASVGAQVNRKYWVGTSSGNNQTSLTIDGNAYAYTAGDTIVVRSGTYGFVQLQNLTSVTVQNDSAGAIVMDGGSAGGEDGTDIYAGINLTNCSHVHVTRNPAATLTVPYGFICQNNTYRPTQLSWPIVYDTLDYVSYFNIGDYIMYFTGYAPTWATTSTTPDSLGSLGFAVLHSKFDSCQNSCEFANGTLSTSLVSGLHRGLEFGWDTIEDVEGGDFVFAQPVDQYKVHDNVFLNVNPLNNNDNGLFHMVGNGNFYRNYGDSTQGHFLRMWSISFGPTPETDSVWDNIDIWTRKYSMFEYQSTVGDNVAAGPNTTYVNFVINNNTAGDLNYQQNTAFGAYFIDNYGLPTGSTVTMANNVLYNAWAQSPGATYPQGSFFQFVQTGVDSLKCRYYSTSSGAGFNEATLYLTSGSPLLNAGTTGYLLSPTDYHGIAFNVSTPSIGAVSGTGSAPPAATYQTITRRVGWRQRNINH